MRNQNRSIFKNFSSKLRNEPLQNKKHDQEFDGAVFSDCSQNENENVASMCWNYAGSQLVACCSGKTKIYTLTATGFKQVIKKQYKTEFTRCLFANDDLYATINNNLIKFWDLRGGISDSIYTKRVSGQVDELFNFSDSLNFTFGTYSSLFYQEYRVKESQSSFVSSFIPQNPINTAKLVGESVVCGGGTHNKGILTILNTNLVQKASIDLFAQQIQVVSVNKKCSQMMISGQNNTIIVFDLPELLPHQIIQIDEQTYILNHSWNHFGNYYIVHLSRRVQIYDKKTPLRGPLKTLPIQKETPISVHPNHDILAYISTESSMPQLFNFGANTS